MTEALKAEEHKALAVAHDAGAEAVSNAKVSLSIPADVKAAIRPYVHPITTAVFGVVKAGVDAALTKLPIVGTFAAGIVNPIIDKLEPAVEAKLTALLA